MSDIDSLHRLSLTPTLQRMAVEGMDGTDEWFRAFLQLHGARMRAFVRRRVRNDADVADIVQQTLLTVLTTFPSFRGEAQVSTWVFGIAHHVAMGHLRSRSRSREMQPLGDAVEPRPAADGSADPYQHLVVTQQLALVRTVVSAQPVGHRDAWRGVVEFGGSYADVARQMDVPQGTVRSRVSRVRAAVRRAIEQAEHGPACR